MRNTKILLSVLCFIFVAGVLCTGCNLSFSSSKKPPQTYEEWQKKYDPNYVPENKIKLPTSKPRAKKVPQTYEEWIKKNPENK